MMVYIRFRPDQRTLLFLRSSRSFGSLCLFMILAVECL
jgi:hypothetical protein